jgi:large subunit ribosomal protein L25
MSNLQLAAIKRDKASKGNLGRLRKDGFVPAIVYGLDKEPEMITVKAVDLRPHLSQRNHIIDLQVGGAGQKVMLKMIERDAIRKDLVHIDFLRVNEERPVIVNVPVTTHGMPYGVKTEGGVFSTMKKFVKLRARIKDIPEKYDIDVSDLKSGVIFYAKDLKLANGVSLVTPGKTALFGVTTGRAEEETPAAAAPAAAAAAAPAADAKKDEKKK